MCLATPMQIMAVEVSDGTSDGTSDGIVERHGVRRRISLLLCPEARVGDYVLVHAGYALGVVDHEEAARTLRLLEAAARDEETP